MKYGKVADMDREPMTIADLGYDDFFEAARVKAGAEGVVVARVIAEHRGAYRVRAVGGEYLAKITGKQAFLASSRESYPAVGDWVLITVLDAEQATIQGMLPRKTVVRRKYGEHDDVQIIASNVDVALVIESADRDYNLNRFERYFAIARDGGVVPAVIFNKTDLIAPEELDRKLAQMRERFKDIEIIPTSTVTEAGLEWLRGFMEAGKTYCFLGSSGVGKSSLINALLGGNELRTGEIGASPGRGKHTTTAREMYWLQSGAIVIDNPGVREVGVTDVEAGIESLFDEIATLSSQCRFTDCGHTQEPGCAVLAALASGALDRGRYAHALSLKKEAGHYALTALEKKQKSRQFGKFMKKAKQDLRTYSHKDYAE